jgi:hypothetical protein
VKRTGIKALRRLHFELATETGQTCEF